MIDSISMYMLMPILQKVDTKNKDANSLNSLSLPNVIEFLGNLIKPGSNLYDENGTMGSGYYSFGGSNELSPRLIRLMWLALPKTSTSYYDLYSAYPDRPLPVFGYNIASRTTNKSISAMQLFTTPDFFILRNPFDVQFVIQNMIEKMEAAKKVLDAQTKIESNTKTSSSNDFYRRQLIEISKAAEDIGLDKRLSSFSAKENFFKNASFSTWSGPNENTFKNNVKTSKDWIAIKEQYKVKTSVEDALFKILYEIDKDSTSTGIMNAWNQFNTVDEKERDILEKEFNLSSKLRSLQRETLSSDQANQQLEQLSNARANIANRSNSNDPPISSTEIELVKSIVNPSSGAFQMSTFGIMQDKLTRLLINNSRIAMTSTVALAFPTFKLYIIEEDAKEFLYFNDFYDYAAVKQIRINKSRKDASETAYIELSNVYGRLSNVMAGRGTKVENPFYIRPDEEEEVNSMYLKPGALIQIRLGYAANLGVEHIVFSGRIQELQGTTTMIIVAQSHGVELTREIGTGKGEDFGGLLNRLTFARTHTTNTNLSLVASILDQAKVPLRGLGTLSPFVGIERIRNVTYDSALAASPESNDVISYSFVQTMMNAITVKIAINSLTGIDAELIDTRLTNVNIQTEANGWFTTLFGRSRWMILNETIWDALQDYNLQLANTICTVRTMDEDNTLVIASDDDVYQRSIEDFIEIGHIAPIIRRLTAAENDPELAVGIIKVILSKENKLLNNSAYPTGSNTPITDMIEQMLAVTAQNVVFNGTNTIAETPIQYAKKVLLYVQSNSGKMIEILRWYRDAAMDEIEAKKKSIRELQDKYKNGSDDRINSTGDVLNNSRIKTVDGEVLQNEITTSGFIFADTSTKICRYLKHVIIAGEKSFRPVSEIHLKQAQKEIIKNNIRLMDGFNRVELSYVDEDMIGSVLNVIGMGELSNTLGITTAITLDSINKTSIRTTQIASISPTIEYEKINTYTTFQKNAAIRGSIIKNNPLIVANSILSNLVKDYYDGEIILLMDPSIEPYDIVIIYDDVNDYWGLIQVKEVTHSISPETGAVTIIKPDMYTKIRLDSHRNTYGGAMGVAKRIGYRALTDVLLPLASIWLGGKLIAGGASLIKRIFPQMTKLGNSFISSSVKKAVQGEAEHIAKLNAGTSAKAINKNIKNITDEIVENLSSEAAESVIKNGTKITDKKSLLSQFAKDLVAAEDDKLYAKAVKEAEVNFKDSDGLGDIVKKIQDAINANKPTVAATATAEEKAQAAKVAEEMDNLFQKKFSSFINEEGATPDSMIARKALLKSFEGKTLAEFGIGSIGATVRGAGNLVVPSMASLKALLGMSLANKVGRMFIPDLSFLSIAAGEFYNQQPISIVGLIHKGEPFISNLDGMKKSEANYGAMDYINMKFNQMFNPLEALIGDVESAIYEIKENPYKDLL
jgi:hypothetical protein